ncbi:MAG: S9 family peptidase [Bacteroidetes bacterium]|nr:S9 family peptidase [Bacteroidota bacterium]
MIANIRIHSIFILFFLSLSFYGCNKNNTAPIIPVENFFRKPDKTSFQISPGGNYISYLAPWKGYMNLFITHERENDSTRISNSDNGDIQKYFWKNDSTIIFLKSIENSEKKILSAVDINIKSEKVLIDSGDTDIKIINMLKNNDSEILVSLNERDKRIFDVYNLNIRSGKLTMTERNPGNITWWFTDNEGSIRIAVTSDGVNSGLLYRKNEEHKFKPVLQTNFKNFIEPVAFTNDNKNIYAITNINRDKSALIEYDLENNKEVREIFNHYEVDLDWAFTSEISNEVCGVSFTTWKKEFKFFCGDWEKAYVNISKKLPGRIISFVNSDSKEETFLIKTLSDKTPGEYYTYNIRSRNLKKLADISPWIDENLMSDMKPISFKSRDGLTIHGYLTVPKGKKALKLPVVVYVHEGPWQRNVWEFNSEVQFLANRGYAVLQINFRGSTGYGKDFWMAGFNQWGLKMQDDITDGVNWIIDQNIADKNRIAVFGKSYGGYAALMGLALSPELYKCGISFSGILNVADLVESIPPQYEPFRDMMYEMVGNPVDNKTELQNVSPSFLIDKFKDPILIAHGDKDQRVKKYEVDRFAAALSTRNVPVNYLIQKNEGHSFKNQKNKYELYGEVEKFLLKYLKGQKKL